MLPSRLCVLALCAWRVPSGVLALLLRDYGLLGVTDEGTELVPVLGPGSGFHAATHVHRIRTDNTDCLAHVLWSQPARQNDPSVVTQGGHALPIGPRAAAAVHRRVKAFNQKRLHRVLA